MPPGRRPSFRPKPKSVGTPADLLVIGLGNPGAQYEHTRHNVGEDALRLLADRHGVALKKAMGVAFWGHVRIGEKLLALGLPGTYMNLSGEGVASLVRRYGIDDLTKLVILHDEVDLILGRIQVKAGGGLAGHNGLKSIKHHLKSEDFSRIRIGIGRPQSEHQAVSDFVLKRPGGDDKIAIENAESRVVEAVEKILIDGLIAAQNRFNS